jgi:hypothetical protein
MEHFLQMPDATALIFSFLDAYALLKISMVSRQAKTIVDSVSANVFAQATKFYLRHWRRLDELLVMKLDADRQELRYEYVLKHSIEQYWLLLHVHLAVGRLIPMHIELQVPSECVQFSRSGVLVPSGASSAFHSSMRIRVTSWKVTHVHAEAPERASFLLDVKHNRRIPLVFLRLEAVTFDVQGLSRSDTRAVHIPFSMVVNIHNAPLDNSLSARERAVLIACVTCMNCHQRQSALRSLDVAEKRHRVLCSTCFQHLYAETCKLHATWKISKYRLARVRHLHHVCNFMPVQMTPSARFGPEAQTVVLKEQMARALGFQSWSEFISNNYKTPLPFGRAQKTGRSRYPWASAPEQRPWTTARAGAP